MSAVRRDDAVEAAIAENVTRWLRFIGWNGEPIEMQTLKVKRDGGYRTNHFAYASDALTVAQLLRTADAWKAAGVFYIMNAIDPAVATRAEMNQWHRAEKDESTSDNEIAARRALFVDIDATRPKNTSCTDVQLAKVQEVADTIADRLAQIVAPASVGAGMSGNGGTVMLALDSLPNTDEVEHVIKGILAALACIYDTAGVEIDPTVCDAKRLCPAWGTMKKKGVAGNLERPHRRTYFACADEVKRLSLDDLQRLLAELIASLTDAQRASVDKVMGKKSAPNNSNTNKQNTAGAADKTDPFKLANGCDSREVARRLGLIDGNDVTCPGCSQTSAPGGRTVILDGGLKCSGKTCAGKGKNGFRTNVDLVAEVKGIKPIEAAMLICEWFGIEVPKREQSSKASSNDNAPTDWHAPLHLPDGTPSVPPFDLEMLPEALRLWLADISERAQCPLEYCAIGAAIALGTVIGRRCTIRPKRYDDWTVVPNLWGAAVGPPGVMKTYALDEAMKPLDRLAALAHEKHKAELKQHEFTASVAKARRAQLEKDIKNAIKNGIDPETLRGNLSECEIPPAPTERRYHTTDTTIEKLAVLLEDNPAGILVKDDELMGFLRTFERDGHQGDRAFYLKGWSGTSGHLVDRMGRESFYVPAVCVSIVGGIQPGPLTEYLIAAARGGVGDDGLVQRFQLLVCPDINGEWKKVDRVPNTDAKNRAFVIFERLAQSQHGEADRDGLHYLHFADDGQTLFDAWHEQLQRRLRSPDESTVITAHLAKYPSLMPSLALIFHLADAAYADRSAGPVSAYAAELAIRWCTLLEAHARRIYQPVIERAPNAGRALGAKIKAGKLQTGFTAREIDRAAWSGLTDRDDIDRALGLLEDLHWIRGYAEKTGGRPTTRYAINPALLDEKKRAA